MYRGSEKHEFLSLRVAGIWYTKSAIGRFNRYKNNKELFQPWLKVISIEYRSFSKITHIQWGNFPMLFKCWIYDSTQQQLTSIRAIVCFCSSFNSSSVSSHLETTSFSSLTLQCKARSCRACPTYVVSHIEVALDTWYDHYVKWMTINFLCIYKVFVQTEDKHTINRCRP